MLKKDSFILKIHAHDSISERDPCRIQITPQHNSLKSRITPELAAAFSYLIYKQSTSLRHEVFSALPNATVLCTVMVIITRKTIVNQEVYYYFCQVIPLFWLRQKMVPYMKYKIDK